jgi:hypothetical protein
VGGGGETFCGNSAHDGGLKERMNTIARCSAVGDLHAAIRRLIIPISRPFVDFFLQKQILEL